MCRPERPNVESKQRKLSLGKIGKLILQWFTLKWILSLWIQLFFYGLPAVTSQVIRVIFLNYCSTPGCRFLTNFPTNPSPFGQPFMSDTINISKTLRPFTTNGLRKKMKKMNIRSGTGPDFWSVSDLINLPDSIFFLLPAALRTCRVKAAVAWSYAVRILCSHS